MGIMLTQMNRREFLTVPAGAAVLAATGCRTMPSPTGSDDARVVFLGTSHGAVRPTRFCSCTLVQYKGRNYLVDAADGAAGRVRWAGVEFWDLNAVFITHPHSDHMGGVPQLLNQYMFSYDCYKGTAPKNKGELRVFFPGEDVLADQRILLNAPVVDAAERLGDSSMLASYRPGLVFDDGFVRVFAYGNDHMGRRPDGTQRAHSILFEFSNGKRLYFSGDVAPAYDLPLDPFRDGGTVDLLVSELVHYPLECAVRRLHGLAIGRICFHHYGDGWEAGQPGRDSRFEDFSRQLGVPAEIVTDGDIRML